ncbi:MAG: hypothetical protein HON90_07570, partial [Halobacteriovoraceae bacterium]|nr:hypothetical protein [Halobacteriovoraceae bacterium]
HSMPLRDQLNEIATDNPQSKITVDLGGIDFVGSSGICHFVETLQIINQTKDEHNKMKLANVSTEFKKIFRLYSIDEAELIWDQFDLDDDETSNLSTRFGNRKRTFSN